MEKKSRKSASKWELNGELALIALWEAKMEELRASRKNSHILAKMVAELQKQGFSYSVEELKTKMHNMTARYRKEKQMIKTAVASHSEWDRFEDMQALFAPFEGYHAEDLVQDSINENALNKKWKNSNDGYMTYLKTSKPNSGQSRVWSQQMEARSPFLSSEENESELETIDDVEENIEADYASKDPLFTNNVNSSSRAIVSSRKMQNQTSQPSSSVSSLISYFENEKKRKTELDMLFAAHSKTVQRFSMKRQAITKARIAQILLEEELLDLKEKENYNPTREKSASTPVTHIMSSSPKSSPNEFICVSEL